MNRLYKLLFLSLILIIGCKNRDIDDKVINQSINSLNMNVFSNEGTKLLSIISPYSQYDKVNNIFNLNETTIKLFKDNEYEYVITADSSILTNNNKLLELKGNVIVKTSNKKEDKLYSNLLKYNIDNSEFLLVGNVKFENKSIKLNSNKAILNKTKNIIEFYKPVKYKVIDSNSVSIYEVKSENAYYNIETKSVTFRSKEERVRTKIYF